MPTPNGLIGTLSDANRIRQQHYRKPLTRPGGLVRRGGLRLGQRIANELLAPGRSWPELFYTESDPAVWALVVAEYSQ